VQTQVLPYLRELVKGGNEVELLTFEPEKRRTWTREEIAAERERLAAEGIVWDCLGYHKRFSVAATAYDILCGTLFTRRRIAKGDIDIVHSRVHVPQLMASLARRLSRKRPKLLFDIRGFMPEEYTDAGRWPENGVVYRTVKRIERWLLRDADGFVVLTEKAQEILFPESRETGRDKFGRPVEVIPCCVDFERRFAGNGHELRERMRAKLGVEGRRVILHLGALGGLYLCEEIADLLSAAKAEDANIFAMFLTQSDPEKIVPLLEARGFAEKDYFVGRVAPAEIQGYLEATDIALSIVKATLATQSRSPTKIPEYLACGLPVIANRGVGDVDSLIEENSVGVILDEFSAEAYTNALHAANALGNVGDRCRETARRCFDLKTVAGERYRRIYKKVLERD